MKKILQLGTGRWGMNHLRVLKSLDVDLFVCDARPEAYEKCCLPLEIRKERFSTDHRAFLDIVDAVDIVTPADSHFALAAEAIERGKDVFVEKPITLDSRQASILVEAAERAKRILQVGYIFRFDPASGWAREAIRQGRFGEVRMVRGRFAGFKRPRNDSGVLLADGIHFIDLIGFLLDREPVRVTAVLEDFLGRGLEDEAWIGLEYEGPGGRARCTVECGYHVPGKHREVTVIGSRSSAVCDFGQATEKVRTFSNSHVPKGSDWGAVEGGQETVSFPKAEPLREELAAFIECLDSRRPPLAGGRDGWRSLRIVEAALASAKEGRTVELG